MNLDAGWTRWDRCHSAVPSDGGTDARTANSHSACHAKEILAAKSLCPALRLGDSVTLRCCLWWIYWHCGCSKAFFWWWWGADTCFHFRFGFLCFAWDCFAISWCWGWGARADFSKCPAHRATGGSAKLAWIISMPFLRDELSDWWAVMFLHPSF